MNWAHSAEVHIPLFTCLVQATARQQTSHTSSSEPRRVHRFRRVHHFHRTTAFHEPTMPPKAVRGSAVGPRQPQRGNIAKETYNAITNPENRSVVTALAFFVGGVAFLHSSWSEILLPP
ncbi:hypothetical protein AC579_4567 [Pseudocercospora musae]|uniref:TOM core complex subunit Tom6 n=1 Tax=Pseudocercospora musae TaxID=113226 RepID=A0A139ITK3_9PEZI|nr:hypothetical protein AC579_4567 [Pseudocercospora musae]KXT18109.1 hypothetical protein AC579_4567 [Pseudocercospora musae]